MIRKKDNLIDAAENTLTFLIARGERDGVANEKTEALAQRMLRRHGSLGPVLESHANDLLISEPISQQSARLITLMPQLARYLAMQRSVPKVISSAKQAGAWLSSRYIGIHYEQIHLLCLDKTGRVLGCPMVQQGTLDETPFYLRNILETVTRLDAKALVISHNHPGGTTKPSRADIVATKSMLAAIGAVDACLLDHIIVADGKAVSLFETEAISRDQFLGQRVVSPMFKNWV